MKYNLDEIVELNEVLGSPMVAFGRVVGVAHDGLNERGKPYECYLIQVDKARYEKETKYAFKQPDSLNIFQHAIEKAELLKDNLSYVPGCLWVWYVAIGDELITIH